MMEKDTITKKKATVLMLPVELAAGDILGSHSLITD